MKNRWWASVASLGLIACLAPAAQAKGLGVEVWTDRGNDAVYQPGEHLEVRARANDDAYLLVYEIDAEGYVRLLYPYRGSTGYIEGRRTYDIPPEQSNLELVVEEQAPVGQCYVVAVAAREPFNELPWYLRPYDMQAENVGYEGMRDDEEGITAEGRIVGDPFVVMEKIRRRVVEGAEDADAFATSYVSYYVHEQVRYPRYLCYDCHRPGRWAWWTGFDPYYTNCSVFDFRVNWSWGWGPGYWFGCVPYYYYVVRYDCPPRYRPFYQDRTIFSSWDGWRRYKGLWGSHLTRIKTDPPKGYVPPSRYPDRTTWNGGKTPPGFIATDIRRGREGLRPRVAVGRGSETRTQDPATRGERRGGLRPREGASPREERPRDQAPRVERPRDGAPRTERPRYEPAPRVERPREDAPQRPRYEQAPRVERPREDSPRYEKPREEKPREESPRVEKPREEKPQEKPREESPRYERKPDQRPAEKSRGDQGGSRRRDDGGGNGGGRSRKG